MHHYRLTKIVATIGPATSSPHQLKTLIEAGVNVIRLNFSHGSYDDHRTVLNAVREIAKAMDHSVAILQDLQGPKLRIGDLVDDGPVTLQQGTEFRICTNPITGNAMRASTSYENLARDVNPGDVILLDDGKLELHVEGVELQTGLGDEVITTVVHGGPLKPQKGINLPGTRITSPSLTRKDVDDLEFGIGIGVDVIALSFVREAADIRAAKEKINALGGTQPLIAKIEKPQAVENLEAIVREADGVMVARGDLGVEMRPEKVPLIQKRLIRLANTHGIPVITATQMLESMIESPRPTRAEASDVANAVFDGSDAVMLSGETAVGAYPFAAVQIMDRIATTVEQDPTWQSGGTREESPDVPNSRDAVAAAKAATSLAKSIGASAIAVLTETGHTARRVSQARPGIPIVVFTEHEIIANRLALWHGVVPLTDPLDDTIEGLVRRVDRRLRSMNIATSGDRIVIVGAVPRSNSAQSVFLEIHHLE